MINKRLFFQFLSVILTYCLFTACSNEQKKGVVKNEEAQDTKKEEGLELEPIEKSTAPRIVFFGNSLSAGYGLDDPENQSFPGIIRQRIKENGLDYTVVNAGLSGETTAAGKNRIEWTLKQPVDIFILELGGNDGLRGIDTEETKRNLQAIIDAVNGKYPDAEIILAGMEALPNMGADYTAGFREVYPNLAKENDVALIPFLLQDVGGETSLNQADGIHPNAEGHKIVADNVWEVLKKFVLPEKEKNSV